MFSVTWIPVVMDDVREEHPIDAEESMKWGVLPWWPIGDYETGVGPTMTYDRQEYDRRPDTPAMDAFEVAYQLIDHRLLNACGAQEIYYGIGNSEAVLNAGLDIHTVGVSNFHHWTAFSPGYINPEEAPPRNAYNVEAHEIGHMLGLGHAPCNTTPAFDGYPYEGAIPGPARSWDYFDDRFAGRPGMRGVEVPAFWPAGNEYVDLMSYCSPGITSDYHYQRAFLLHQSEDYWAGIQTTPADDCTPAAVGKPIEGLVKKSAKTPEPPRSIAISGSIDAHGTAAVRMAQPTSKPAWPAPKTGDLVIVILDAGGLELLRQPVRTSPLSHSDGRMAWGARVPYFEGAATVVLRTPQGDLRAAGEVLTTK